MLPKKLLPLSSLKAFHWKTKSFQLYISWIVDLNSEREHEFSSVYESYISFFINQLILHLVTDQPVAHKVSLWSQE